MEIAAKCPHCAQAMMVPNHLAGKQVRCPGCNPVLSVPPTTSSLPPAPPPEQSSVSDESLYSELSEQKIARAGLGTKSSVSHHRGVKRKWQSSSSIWDVFDFQFRRYVTPLIVKITWIVFLAVTAAWLTFAVAIFVMALPGNSELSFSSNTGFPSDVSVSSPQYRQGRIAESPGPFWKLSEAALFKVAMMITTVILASIGVLWVRVVLEAIIVIFNIAETLSEIRNETVAREQ